MYPVSLPKSKKKQPHIAQILIVTNPKPKFEEVWKLSWVGCCVLCECDEECKCNTVTMFYQWCRQAWWLHSPQSTVHSHMVNLVPLSLTLGASYGILWLGRRQCQCCCLTMIVQHIDIGQASVSVGHCCCSWQGLGGSGKLVESWKLLPNCHCWCFHFSFFIFHFSFFIFHFSFFIFQIGRASCRERV